ARELNDSPLASRKQLLAGELGRGPQIEPLPSGRGGHQIGRKGMQVGLVPWRGHERRGFDLEEIPRREELPQRRRDARAPDQKWPPVGVADPERRGTGHLSSFGRSATLRANGRENRWRMAARSVWCGPNSGRPGGVDFSLGPGSFLRLR